MPFLTASAVPRRVPALRPPRPRSSPVPSSRQSWRPALTLALLSTALVVSSSAPSSAATAATTSSSWNPNVTCGAAVTTLATLLGSQRSAAGGATFAGGGFKPGLPDKKAQTPPCSASGAPTFVELRRVQVASCSKINSDGDWTCGLFDPTRPDGDMNRIHIETDQSFRSRGGWSIPPTKTLIDVQGFVFWDPGHTSTAFHNHSGWELHSFTGWRRAA